MSYDSPADQRLHAAVLVTPSGRSRRQRMAQHRSTARLVAARQREATSQARRVRRTQAAHARETVFLPAAGERLPGSLRTPGRLGLVKHQDTSASLAGAYPFLAEGGLGSDGVFVGQDLYSGGSFVYDPWVLYAQGVITAPNIILAGIVGSGKSCLAKSLYTRSIPFGRRVYGLFAFEGVVVGWCWVWLGVSGWCGVEVFR